jgi:chromosome segregation ATPase
MMDENDKQWIEARLDERLADVPTKQWIEQKLDERLADFGAELAKKFATKDDLNHAMNHLLAEIGRRHEELKAELSSVNARLTLHGGLIQSGSRAITRLIRYAENSEARWVALGKRIQALEESVAGGPAA